MRWITIPTLLLQVVTLALFLLTVEMSGAEGATQSLALLVSGPYSMTFWLGAVVVGSIVPLVLEVLRRQRANPGLVAISAVLILLGGLLVKHVIMAAGQVVLS